MTEFLKSVFSFSSLLESGPAVRTLLPLMHFTDLSRSHSLLQIASPGTTGHQFHILSLHVLFYLYNTTCHFYFPVSTHTYSESGGFFVYIKPLTNKDRCGLLLPSFSFSILSFL